MDLISENYITRASEADLTKAAVEFLASAGSAAMRKLKPLEYGENSTANREALKLFITQASALPGKKTTAFEMVEAAVENMAQSKLRYSDYQRLADLEAMKLIAKGNPGLRVERNADGRFLCLPMEGSPAWRYRIRKGDELVSVDGRSVRGMRLFQVGVLIRGPVNTSVQVQVRQISGRSLSAALVREVEAGGKLSLTEEVGSPLLRIPSFDTSTSNELKLLLSKLPPQSSLTLDLQGNGGGEVQAAVDAAGLFLPGKRPLPIARRQARGKETLWSTDEEPVTNLLGITILIDSGTASSAELLALALQEGMNVPVTLSGSRSYGKGTFQFEETLRGGGRLTFAAGELTTMKGTAWEGKGVEPSFAPGGR